MILIQEIVMKKLSIPLQASSVVVCSKERVLICGRSVFSFFYVLQSPQEGQGYCIESKKVKGVYNTPYAFSLNDWWSLGSSKLCDQHHYKVKAKLV